MSFAGYTCSSTANPLSSLENQMNKQLPIYPFKSNHYNVQSQENSPVNSNNGISAKCFDEDLSQFLHHSTPTHTTRNHSRHSFTAILSKSSYCDDNVPSSSSRTMLKQQQHTTGSLNWIQEFTDESTSNTKQPHHVIFETVAERIEDAEESFWNVFASSHNTGAENWDWSKLYITSSHSKKSCPTSAYHLHSAQNRVRQIQKHFSI